jgi:hypothetical protein
MENAVFWNIKTQFVTYRRHITSPLQSPVSQCYVRFEGFTVVAMKNAVFRDVTKVGYCENRRFEAMYFLHHQGNKNRQAR